MRGEGDGELPASRSNRFVAGLEAALEAAIGPRPAAIGWRIDDGQRDSPVARPRLVGRRDRRRRRRGRGARGPGRGRPAGRRGAAPDRVDHRVAPRQRGGGPAGRVRGLGAARRPGGRDPVRRAGGPAMRAVHPGPPARDGGHAPGAARAGAAAPRRREPRPGGHRRRGDRLGPSRRPRRPHRGPAPRAVPLGRLPGAAADDDGGARGGRAGGVPVGRRIDDPRLRRARVRTPRRSRPRCATRPDRAAWPGGSRSSSPATTERASSAS